MHLKGQSGAGPSGFRPPRGIDSFNFRQDAIRFLQLEMEDPSGFTLTFSL